MNLADLHKRLLVAKKAGIITNGLVLNLDAGNPLSYPGTGTTWTDLSGNGNNGTLVNGPTFNSANGGSIVFDGHDDHVNSGNVLNFERNNSFSISSWVKISSLSNIAAIISKMDSSFRGYYFGYEADGSLQLILRNTLNTNFIRVLTNINLISINTFINVCVIYNGSSLASGITFYRNSINYPINTIFGDNLNQTIITTYPLTIGARVSTNSSFLNGNIFQVQIYNRALSASEVLQNYNATKSRFGL